MAKLILDINDNDLSVRAEGSITTDNILLRGSISFSAGWEKYAKTVVFYQNPRKTYRVIVSGEEIDVPSEAVKVGGHLFVGVYGIYTEDGTVYRKVTNIASVPVTAGAYDEANTPEPPTVTEYEQMISIMQAYMDAAEVTERAERAAAQIDAKESEANAYADEAKAAANAAKKDAEGASASALSAAGSASASSVSQKAAETAKAAAESNATSASASAQNAKTYSEAAEASAKSAADTVAVSDISQLANALKGEKRGEGLSFGEVSPVPHKVKVTARSKNLLPFPYMMASGVVNGITYTVNGDGSVTANGTATENAIFTFFVKSADEPLHFLSKGTYTLSCTQIEGARFMYGPVNNGVRDWVTVPFEGATVTLTDTYFIRNLYVEITKGTTVNNFTFYPQVEEGSNVTEWTPYVDITAVKSRNLIPYPYNETTKTVNGITFSVHNDGRIAVKGTATAQCVMKLVGSELALPNGTYFLSGCNSDASQTKGKFSLGLKENGSVEYIGVTASGYKFTITDTVKFEALYIEVLSGSIVDNLVVFPMLNYGDAALPFEKHFEPRPLNLKSCGKNLIPYPYYDTTRAVNGITFTDNGDGSITVNGTATDRANFTLAGGTQNNPLVPPGQTYTLSGTPKGDNNNCRIQFWDYGGDTQGNGHAFNFTNAKNWDHNIAISVFKGFTANNMVFYPQLELGAVKTEYEPYKAGETVAVADASGQEELASVAPNMTVLADREGVLLGCEYNEDANKVIKKLIAAVKELGGNI